MVELYISQRFLTQSARKFVFGGKQSSAEAASLPAVFPATELMIAAELVLTKRLRLGCREAKPNVILTACRL